MRSEDGDGLFYQTRKQVLWRYEGRELDLLVFYVKTEGSKTLGFLLRHHAAHTRMLASFRGDYACGRAAELLQYVEHRERSRDEPILFCLDRLFFGELKEAIGSGFPIDYRAVDRQIERALREHRIAAKEAARTARYGLLARAHGLRALRPGEGV